MCSLFLGWVLGNYNILKNSFLFTVDIFYNCFNWCIQLILYINIPVIDIWIIFHAVDLDTVSNELQYCLKILWTWKIG